jgi:hypothetical protein
MARAGSKARTGCGNDSVDVVVLGSVDVVVLRSLGRAVVALAIAGLGVTSVVLVVEADRDPAVLLRTAG